MNKTIKKNWQLITGLLMMVLVLALFAVYAAPVSADGGDVTVILKDSDGIGIDGATVSYYDGGWQLMGITGDSGVGTLIANVPKTTDIELRGPSGSFKWKLVDPTTNPTLSLSTIEVTVKLETCGGDPLVGQAQRYYQGWKPIGDTEATIELLPFYDEANTQKNWYDFQVKYDNRTSATIKRYIADDPIVVFKTTKVDFFTSGDVFWYNGGWKPFTSPKEVIGGPGKWADFKFGDTHNPTVRLDIDGCDLSGYPALVRLEDSQGNGLPGGYVQYRPPTWTEFGTTDENGNAFALLPQKPWGVKITYEWITNRVDPWDYDANPSVTFKTIDTLVTLKTCEGVGLEGGVAEYQSGYWRPIGTTDENGEIHKEMLPANLQFKMSYAYGADRFYQDTGADPSVDFTTTKVTLNYPGTITYLSGYWRPFTNPMEMMPGRYKFKFEGAGPTVRETLSFDGCEFGGTVALINLIDSYGSGIFGATAEWYRTSSPAAWVSVPGATDSNGNLFALVGSNGPKFKILYNCKNAWEQHNLLADPNVDFQTGRVESNTYDSWRSTVGGSCAVWQGLDYSEELLPGTVEFKQSSPYCKEYHDVVAGVANSFEESCSAP